MQDVAQKEMKLLSRINEKLNNLKEKAKPDFDITDTEDEDMSNDNKQNIIYYIELPNKRADCNKRVSNEEMEDFFRLLHEK